MSRGSLTLLQEEAYYKVLKAFAAGSYDLVSVFSNLNAKTAPSKYW